MAERGNKGRYYTPPSAIQPVVGVTVTTGELSDEYRGNAEALSAAGLLELAMFPGQPGMPVASASLRPTGARLERGEYWFTCPGYMRVFREGFNGMFRIVLNVPTEVRDARIAAREARERQADAAAEAVLAQLPTIQREYVDCLCQRLGRPAVKRGCSSRQWLSQQRIDPKVGAIVLRCLEVFDLAEIERELILRPLDAAQDVLSRVRLAAAVGEGPSR